MYNDQDAPNLSNHVETDPVAECHLLNTNFSRRKHDDADMSQPPAEDGLDVAHDQFPGPGADASITGCIISYTEVTERATGSS